MSKKLCDENENGYTSDISYTSTSNSELDIRKKGSCRRKTQTESEKNESRKSRHGTSNKLTTPSGHKINKTDTTSRTSLDENLYGVSDVYCKTLKQLKTKLLSLNAYQPTSSLLTFQNAIDADSNLRHESAASKDKEDYKISTDLKLYGYLSDKETNTSKHKLDKKIIHRLSTTKSDHVRKKCESKPKFSKEVNKTIFKKHTSDKKINLDTTATDSDSLELVTILKPVRMPSDSTFISYHSKADKKCLGSCTLRQSPTMLKNMIIRDHRCTGTFSSDSKKNTSNSTNSLKLRETTRSLRFYKSEVNQESTAVKSIKLSPEVSKNRKRTKTVISSSYYKPQVNKKSTHSKTTKYSSYHKTEGSKENAISKAPRSSSSYKPEVHKETDNFKSPRSLSSHKNVVSKEKALSKSPKSLNSHRNKVGKANTHSKTHKSSSYYKPTISNQNECARNRSRSLTSSSGSDCTSSDNLKVNPSIITRNVENKSKRLHKRRNKIAPMMSETRCDSSLSSNETNKVNNLFLKYYNDTPEITPISCSTPPLHVSTCESPSSTETTPRSKTNPFRKYSNVPFDNKPSVVYTSRQNHTSLEQFGPVFSSGLDVPRKSTQVLHFPSITKITNLIQYPEVVVMVNNDCNSLKFSTLAKKIKNDMCVSREDFSAKERSIRTDNLNSVDTNTQIRSLSYKNSISSQNKRIELSHYEVSSTDSITEENESLIENLDIQSYTNSDDEQPSKCYCLCNWMFPKKRHNFFT